jgi:hypothetical protein
VSIPLSQSLRIAGHLAAQKVRRREEFPLIVKLEPLFACNLACAGCGKIQHPADVLRRRMPAMPNRAGSRGSRRARPDDERPMVAVRFGDPAERDGPAGSVPGRGPVRVCPTSVRGRRLPHAADAPAARCCCDGRP